MKPKTKRPACLRGDVPAKSNAGRTIPLKRPAVKAADIATARILMNRIPELSAADPLKLALLIPEILVAFRVSAISRLTEEDVP